VEYLIDFDMTPSSQTMEPPSNSGRFNKQNLTQFKRALNHLGIEIIAAYSPQARGRSERVFRTHQALLPKELAHAGITEIGEANRYLKERYMSAFNQKFMQPTQEKGSAFIPYCGGNIGDILCEQYESRVGNDNCVQFERLKLQIPETKHRMHYVKVRVWVHRYPNGSLSVFHGPQRLADYDGKEILIELTTTVETSVCPTQTRWQSPPRFCCLRGSASFSLRRTVYLLQKRTKLFVANNSDN
jgi:hypothetical protein